MAAHDSTNDTIVGSRINFGTAGLANWMIDEAQDFNRGTWPNLLPYMSF